MALSDERLVPVMKKKRDSLDSAQTAKRLRSQYEDLAVIFFLGAGASMAVACIVRFIRDGFLEFLYLGSLRGSRARLQ